MTIDFSARANRVMLLLAQGWFLSWWGHFYVKNTADSKFISYVVEQGGNEWFWSLNQWIADGVRVKIGVEHGPFFSWPDAAEDCDKAHE